MIEFSNARNGSKTCSLGGKYLHSAYNPEREAERFVSQLSCDFSPKIVVLTEPCLPYCVPFLKKRFPNALIAAIRFCTDFSAYNDSWDYFFSANENLDSQLFDSFGEDGIACALFAAWQPSEMLFPAESSLAWNKIRCAVLKSRDVIATRSFFAKRWLKNTLRFFSFANRFAFVEHGNCDIVVAASGPSLKIALAALKKYREKYFLIAVSSALEPLLYEGIIPDLCISTDGGQWAKRHLEKLSSCPELPLATSAESAIPCDVLFENPIIPLVYGDAPESIFANEFAKKFGIAVAKAYRNGTVSGTAVQFALEMTTARIFCVGLDLCEAKGFQHLQPNALDKINSVAEYRLYPCSTRLSLAGRKNGSLAIYRDWFSSRSGDFSSRVFRVAEKTLSPLGKILDIGEEDFSKRLSEGGDRKKPVVHVKNTISPSEAKERFEVIKKILNDAKNLSLNDERATFWFENIFPSEYIHYKKYYGSQQQEIAEKTLFEKRDSFFSELISGFEQKWK